VEVAAEVSEAEARTLDVVEAVAVAATGGLAVNALLVRAVVTLFLVTACSSLTSSAGGSLLADFFLMAGPADEVAGLATAGLTAAGAESVVAAAATVFDVEVVGLSGGLLVLAAGAKAGLGAAAAAAFSATGAGFSVTSE
jgi:hypothetical protein